MGKLDPHIGLVIHPFLNGWNAYKFLVEQKIVKNLQPAREKKGTLIQDVRANMNPTNRGLRAAPVVRATPVNPPAADRSSA
jgi:hypothetical protein